MPSDMTRSSGCPRCSQSIGEKIVSEILRAEQGSEFGREWSPSWLGRKRMDFNVHRVSLFEPSPCMRIVEVDGMQHFKDFSVRTSPRQQSLTEER